jgi:oxygen-dependent protoporphyrinogen oxidase
MKRVVIVGGGITGLSTAYFAQERARAAGQPLEILLIEREPRLGGKILTERTPGFLIEGGPDAFLTLKPWAIRLSEQLGLADQLINPPPDREAFILYRDRLRRLPQGAMGFIPTNFAGFLKSDLFSLWGKMRMGLDLLVPARRDGREESLGSFIRRRLGSELLERLAEPLLAGIYAGDADRLSLPATFPQLSALERQHGGLIRGALAHRRASRNQQSQPLFVTLQSGLGSLIEALEAQLQNVRIITGERVTKLSRRKTSYQLSLVNGQVLEPDAVVLATPAYVTAELLEPLSFPAAQLLAGITYVSTTVVTLALRTSDVTDPLDATGFLVPRSERRKLTAATWSSSKWPGRAPAGFALLRVFFGRAGEEDRLVLNDAELKQLAYKELKPLLGLKGEPVLTRVHRWPKAMPQYETGHLERLAQVKEILSEHPGLILAGAAYRGIGLPDCIRQAQEAAECLFQTAMELPQHA